MSILDYQGQSPTDGDVASKVWRASQYERGVAFLCPWEDPFGGFPEHSRRCARALSDAGEIVQLRSVNPGLQWNEKKDHVDARAAIRSGFQDLLEATITNYSFEINQIVLDDTFLHRLIAHPFLEPEILAKVNKNRILSTVFERDRVSAYAARALNALGQVWVANEYDREMLVSSGVNEQIARVVPLPYFDNDPLLKLRDRKRFPGVPRFYHIGKWEPRKEHRNAIGAFMLAFEPGEAHFYIKTSTTAPDFGDYPQSPQDAVHEWLGDSRIKSKGWNLESVNRSLFFVQRLLSPSRLLQLHGTGDVYVSLSRGEGFDMPAFDAKLAGNPMLYTPSGGPQSYADDSCDVVVPRSGSVPCHDFYQWGDAHYLDYDVEAAARGFREAHARSLAGPGPAPLPPDRFRSERVGATMRDHLREAMA